MNASSSFSVQIPTTLSAAASAAAAAASGEHGEHWPAREQPVVAISPASSTMTDDQASLSAVSLPSPSR